MSELLKRTDSLWSGKASTAEPDYHPFGGPRLLEELASGVAFYKAFVNVTAVKTGEGLIQMPHCHVRPVDDFFAAGHSVTLSTPFRFFDVYDTSGRTSWKKFRIRA